MAIKAPGEKPVRASLHLLQITEYYPVAGDPARLFTPPRTWLAKLAVRRHNKHNCGKTE